MQSFTLKFLGVTILQGVEFPIFLLIFEWALQQCSATALPVICVCHFCLSGKTIDSLVVVGGDLVRVGASGRLVAPKLFRRFYALFYASDRDAASGERHHVGWPFVRPAIKFQVTRYLVRPVLSGGFNETSSSKSSCEWELMKRFSRSKVKGRGQYEKTTV